MAENMFYLSLDPYGDGTEPTATKGKLIAICEGWATLTEYLITSQEYSDTYYINSTATGTATDNLEAMDYTQVPSSSSPTSYFRSWFFHQLFFDILDDEIDSNSLSTGTDIYRKDPGSSLLRKADDQLYITNGTYLSVEPIFDELDSDLREIEDMRSALLLSYPSQANEINDLFDSYLTP